MTAPIGSIGANPTGYEILDRVLDIAGQNQDSTLPPPIQGDTSRILQQLLAMPELAAPLMSSGISLEVLVEAIGSEERKVSINSSKEVLAAKATERKNTNDQQLVELGKQIAEMNKKETLSPFKKFFNIFSMVVGAIASIATIAVGVVTANPLLVAAGVIMAVMTVDSIVSAATDGKYSIAAGVGEVAKKCGASDKTAQIIGMAVSMAIMITGVVLSIAAGGGGAASAIEKLGATGAKVLDITNKATKAVNVVSGLASIGNGALTIASAVYDYNITMSKSFSKELEAVLEQIKEATDSEEEFLKAILEKYNTMMGKVTDIINDLNEAQMAISSGGEGATLA